GDDGAGFGSEFFNRDNIVGVNLLLLATCLDHGESHSLTGSVKRPVPLCRALWRRRQSRETCGLLAVGRRSSRRAASNSVLSTKKSAPAGPAHVPGRLSWQMPEESSVLRHISRHSDTSRAAALRYARP